MLIHWDRKQAHCEATLFELFIYLISNNTEFFHDNFFFSLFVYVFKGTFGFSSK